MILSKAQSTLGEFMRRYSILEKAKVPHSINNTVLIHKSILIHIINMLKMGLDGDIGLIICKVLVGQPKEIRNMRSWE